MLPRFYREVFERIAMFYLLYLHGGIHGIVAVIAITQRWVSVMIRYL